MDTIRIIPADNWKNDSFVEIPDRSVSDQLDALDKAGAGVGFVFVLQPTIAESIESGEDESTETGRLDMSSFPVIKLKNVWYVVDGGDFADVVASIIRMITSSALSK